MSHLILLRPFWGTLPLPIIQSGMKVATLDVGKITIYQVGWSMKLPAPLNTPFGT